MVTEKNIEKFECKNSQYHLRIFIVQYAQKFPAANNIEASLTVAYIWIQGDEKLYEIIAKKTYEETLAETQKWVKDNYDLDCFKSNLIEK